ncbi:MAG: hypothetical protein WCJ30_01115 [Deltaproteobacteria bacterium]
MKSLLSLSLLVSLSACAQSVVGAGADAGDTAQDSSPSTGPGSPMAACTPVLASFTPEQEVYGSVPAYFGTSPGDRMILRTTGFYRTVGTYHRASTGDVMFHPPVARIVARDAAWQREVRLSSNTFETAMSVATTITNRTLFEPPPPSSARQAWDAGALSADGAVLYAGACLSDHVHVASWNIDEARALGEIDIPATCTQWNPPVIVLLPTRDASVILVGVTGDGRLHRVDLATHAVVSITAHAASTDPAREWLGSPLVDAVLTPDGQRVLTTGVDLSLREWNVADLHAAAPDVAIGLGRTNTNIYATPFSVSPAAVTTAGDLIAYVGPAGDVVLRSRADGRTAATLREPVTGATMPGTTRDAPLALAFARDGSFLAASYADGLAIWTCPGHTWPAPSAPLEVTIDGPSRIPAGSAQTFTATHHGTEHVHSHRFFVDGAAAGDATFERSFTWTATTTGLHEVRVEIDDGLDRGSALAPVDVSP